MWYTIKDDRIYLQIIAKPNSKQTKLLRIDEQGMHVALNAKPHQGEANAVLIAFLAKLFHVPKTHLMLEKGQTGKFKRVSLPYSEQVRKVIMQSTPR